MFNKRISIERLFRCPPKGNYDELLIDYESVSCITPHTTSQVICDIIKEYSPSEHPVIFDSTAGCGGDTTMLASIFGCVISCEINHDRYQMLLNNITTFNLKNVIPINCNSTEVIAKISSVDIVYVDPPWGGRGYKKRKNLRLTIGPMFVDEFVNYIFDDEVQQSNIKMIAIKLPLNYDMYTFSANVYGDMSIMVHVLEKMLLVIVRRNTLVK